ncbi:MAG: helix-turn-helix transcriptional regulator [Clostridia bacterium]|nr:helix-turn-helix transcriptional regulator [Clostridia bacterium]
MNEYNKDEEFIDFGKCIRRVRLKNKLTQAEFGEIIGKSAATIYAYENNTIVPPFRVLQTIADIFHVAIGELMEIEERLLDGKTIREIQDMYRALTGIEDE